MNKKTYIIWSIEHNAWWKPRRAGYTTSRHEAGEYDFAQACDIVEGANIGLKDVPNEAMIEWQDMAGILKEAESKEESDNYDRNTTHQS